MVRPRTCCIRSMNFDEQIANISRFITLEPGDVIFSRLAETYPRVRNRLGRTEHIVDLVFKFKEPMETNIEVADWSNPRRGAAECGQHCARRMEVDSDGAAIRGENQRGAVRDGERGGRVGRASSFANIHWRSLFGEGA
jgi:hypothetical protein